MLYAREYHKRSSFHLLRRLEDVVEMDSYTWKLGCGVKPVQSVRSA